MNLDYFEKHKDVGPLLLRIGLFITLMFSVIVMKLKNTTEVAKVYNAIGLGWLGGETAVLVVGVILGIIALMMLVGYYPRVAAGLLVLFFIVTISQTLGTPVFDKIKAWKDFGLLGAALYLLFAGSGPYSIHKE